MGSGDAGLAGIPLFGKRFRIDCHATDKFFDFLQIPWPQMGEMMMPNAVWQRLWSDWPGWLAPDRFERLFVAHRLEAQKLAMRLCKDDIAEDDVCPSDGMDIDFESVSKQNIAGQHIRIHPGNVQYLLQGHLHMRTVLAFNRDINAPGADAMELSLLLC